MGFTCYYSSIFYVGILPRTLFFLILSFNNAHIYYNHYYYSTQGQSIKSSFIFLPEDIHYSHFPLLSWGKFSHSQSWSFSDLFYQYDPEKLKDKSSPGWDLSRRPSEWQREMVTVRPCHSPPTCLLQYLPKIK